MMLVNTQNVKNMAELLKFDTDRRGRSLKLEVFASRTSLFLTVAANDNNVCIGLTVEQVQQLADIMNQFIKDQKP